MVKGLENFAEFFKDYNTNYVLIGGAACDILINDAGLNFRATKDLDIILIVEALSKDFISRFWEFIKQGVYEQKQNSTGERKYYRFLKPQHKEFPVQIELFARKPDFLTLRSEANLSPIPTDEDLSSLSAILMNDDYYQFTITRSINKNELQIASTETLICLKAKAYLDLTERKLKGEQIDSKVINKHKNDVIRLATLLYGDAIISLPTSIKNDMQDFIDEIQKTPIDYKQIGKSLGIKLDEQSIIEQLKRFFQLN